jgi:hypothetical protein
MPKARYFVVFSLLLLLTILVPAQEISLGFAPLRFDNVFMPLAGRLSDQSTGQSLLWQAIQTQAPYLHLAEDRRGRYYSLAKIQAIRCWQYSDKTQKDRTALLAEISLRLCIYDVERQEYVLPKTTVSGYAAVVPSPGITAKQRAYWEQVADLLLQAFSDSAEQAAAAIATRLPLSDRIREIRSDGKIVISLGERHGLRKNDVLEIRDGQDRTLARCEAFQVQPDQCVAVEVERLMSQSPQKEMRVVWMRVRPHTGEEERKNEKIQELWNVRKVAVLSQPVDIVALHTQYLESLLTASLEKETVVEKAPIIVNFQWSAEAPATWYLYVFYCDNIDSQKAYMFFPNGRVRSQKIEPGKSYSFPGKGWGWPKMTQTLPPNAPRGRDQIVVLLSSTAINLWEKLLDEAVQKKERFSTLPLSDFPKSLAELQSLPHVRKRLEVQVVK